MILKNARIVNEQFQYEMADIWVKDGRIATIGRDLEAETRKGDGDEGGAETGGAGTGGEGTGGAGTGGQDEQVIDCRGKTVIPGLFDIHTHECIGYQLSECTQESLGEMAEFYGRNGVTSYLATIDSQKVETLEQMCGEIGRYMGGAADTGGGAGGSGDAEDGGEAAGDAAAGKAAGGAAAGEAAGGAAAGGSARATIRGIHIEGMFFCGKRKGGHPAELLIPPDAALVRRLDEISGGAVKLVCVAPELEGAEVFIRELSGDMAVSLAHTDATYEETRRAVRLGARSFTHLFNGMRPLHHREPGVIGAALDSPETYKEIVADGMHLAPAIIRSVYRVTGPDHMILISDSCTATGLADGIYEIGKEHDRRIEVKNGLAHLEGTDTICGSTFCLYQMFKNAVMNIGIDFMGALKACTINPARLVGLDREIGSISIGKSADLVVIDNDMNICDVYINGKQAGKKGGTNVF